MQTYLDSSEDSPGKREKLKKLKTFHTFYTLGVPCANSGMSCLTSAR